MVKGQTFCFKNFKNMQVIYRLTKSTSRYIYSVLTVHVGDGSTTLGNQRGYTVYTKYDALGVSVTVLGVPNMVCMCARAMTPLAVFYCSTL